METQQIIITAVSQTTPEVEEAIRNLAQKIGENFKQLTHDDINEMITSSNTTILIAKKEEQIVGMVTLLVYRIPYVKKASIDDLIIDESYRGLGIAKSLMNEAIRLAKEKGASYIDLTARPRRAEGNSLYEKFGFQKRDTNVYRLIFDYDEV